MFYIKQNFLSKQECDYFISLASSPSDEDRLSFGDTNDLWNKRLTDITKHSIVDKVSSHIKNVFNLDLQIEEAQIQNWIEGSLSEFHTHVRWPQVKYNSLIYLNDNFEGGEFITPYLQLKPEPGLLTFFDGSKTPHGLSQVKNNDRFTLIFWWKR